MQDAGCRMQDSGFRIQDAGWMMSVPNTQLTHLLHLVANRKGSASTLGGAGGSVARLRNCVDLCAGAWWIAVRAAVRVRVRG